MIASTDTEQVQLAALQRGISTVNIGQNPFAMGRLSAEFMLSYLTKGQLPDKRHYYLDFHYCTVENASTCKDNTLELQDEQ
ncbi:hypothetical protein DRW07_13615 [Alteromonas sediminis]|uniref:Periplasmic binding protein domain-containing protein n=1 Tax=Alteromonas sediminis TaxID=2259342 RepID=A0A3N5Z5Z6_9ALTE|nr:sugar ABC transporter substrate-binding protein [Alteromonas sediminis]RPJ65844.1 hypothetical protein DRW07_13615 [Alteromonas sediminis]